MKRLISLLLLVQSLAFIAAQPNYPNMDEFVDNMFDLTWDISESCLENLDPTGFETQHDFVRYLWSCLILVNGWRDDITTFEEFNSFYQQTIDYYNFIIASGIDTPEEFEDFITAYFEKHTLAIYERYRNFPDSWGPCHDNCRKTAIEESLLCSAGCLAGPAGCWVAVACVIFKSRQFDRCLEACN